MNRKTLITVLRSILRNPRLSDRLRANKVGLSQPTISRTRNKIEQTNLIRYEAIPNLRLLGYKIIVFSVARPTALKDNRTVFALRGRTDNVFVMSVHSSYDDFLAFSTEHYASNEKLFSTHIPPAKGLSFRDLDISLLLFLGCSNGWFS